MTFALLPAVSSTFPPIAPFLTSCTLSALRIGCWFAVSNVREFVPLENRNELASYTFGNCTAANPEGCHAFVGAGAGVGEGLPLGTGAGDGEAAGVCASAGRGLLAQAAGNAATR